MKALVLSGGGAKGAYQAGVVRYLMGDLKKSYDIFTGISVGALNAGLLAQFCNPRTAASELERMWLKTETKDVHKSWFFGKLAALWRPSLRNSEPLRQMVYKNIHHGAFEKRLIVGAVSLDDGEYYSWTEKSPYILDAILASSSFPTMLKPVMLQGRRYTDGGVRTVTPIKDAIMAGATEIDVVMCSPDGKFGQLKKKPNTIDVAMRTISIMGDEIVDKDLKLANLYNKLAKAGLTDKRLIGINLIRPLVPMGEPLEFERGRIMEEMLLGYHDVKKRGMQPLENLI